MPWSIQKRMLALLFEFLTCVGAAGVQLTPSSSDLLLYTTPTEVLKTWSQDAPPMPAIAPSISHVGLAPSARLTLTTAQDAPCPTAHRPHCVEQALHTSTLSDCMILPCMPAGELCCCLWQGCTTGAVMLHDMLVCWNGSGSHREQQPCLVVGKQHAGSAVQLRVQVACLLAAHLPPHRQPPAAARCCSQVVGQHLGYTALVAVGVDHLQRDNLAPLIQPTTTQHYSAHTHPSILGILFCHNAVLAHLCRTVMVSLQGRSIIA